MRKIEPFGPEIPESPYPVFLRGEVSPGYGRGSKVLGIPTGTIAFMIIANLPESVASFAGDHLETGIYYGWASVGSDPQVWPAVMSFGWNPYYKNEKRSAVIYCIKAQEVHIIHEFDKDFYGLDLRMLVLGYLRDEKNYPSLDDLISDINLDKEIALISLKRPHYQFLRFTSVAHASIPSPTIPSVQSSGDWLQKGNELLDLSKFKEAMDAYKSALKLSPSRTCHFYLGNIDDARDCWQSSLKLDMNRSDAHSNLANIYALKYKDFKKAIEHYESALLLNDQDGEIHYNYAVILDFQGDLEKCIQHYQKARKLGVEIADKNLRNAMAKLIGKNTKD